jgi:cell division protein FtsW
MGEGTSVNMVRPAKVENSQRALRLGVDVPLLLIVLSLVVFGLLMVYSASEDASVLRTQVLGLAVGGVAAFFLARIDYHRLRRVIVLGGIVTWILLATVLFVGDTRNSAVRTLMSGSIQPSELAKPVLVIYLAFWLSSKKEKLSQISFGLIPMAVIIGLTVVFIVLQPDYSAAITLIILGVLLFFLAGGKLHQTIIVIAIILFMGFLAFNLHISSTITNRINEFDAGLKDPLNGPVQVLRCLEAIVKGQFFGVGIGNSDVKFTLPSSSRDTIFVVVVQETGSIFASLIILAYMLICWRGSVIAQRAPDPLGGLLAMGLTTWITFEALINIGMTVGLVPVAGNALPFISAGGSNLACSLASIGVVMSVARASVTPPANNNDKDGRSFSAIVNLRRGDGRRSVSRSRRSSSSRQ